MGGLSPRVRGNPHPPRRQCLCHRSIPACAGEPRSRPGPPAAPRVYPRVCGGTRKRVAGPEPQIGLSPRVRGNRSWVRGGYPLKGSIPACAGEPVLSRWPAGVAGSIPACAGEPSDENEFVLLVEVYPRVCGGTSTLVAISQLLPGLSPRVRGNLVNRAHQIHGARSIPACAGEPGGGATRDKIQGVYPRVCGGTTPWSRLCSRPIGLSPRVRGNPPLGLAFAGQQGSIPACAGEPFFCCPSICRCRVYPRVCGGTSASGGGG